MNKNILIVEDEVPLQSIIKSQIEKSGLNTFVSRDVDTALKIIEENKIDAIWLDHYLLGSKDGLDLVSNLKSAGSNFRNIPIFVVSNTASPSKVQSYLRLGINKYFTKSNTKLEDIVNDLKKNIEK